MNFNQDNNGSDYADWGDGVVPADGKPNTPAQVQDAFGEPGDTAAQEPNLGPNELAALDVVGWNLTAAGLALKAQVPVNLTWKDASAITSGTPESVPIGILALRPRCSMPRITSLSTTAMAVPPDDIR